MTEPDAAAWRALAPAGRDRDGESRWAETARAADPRELVQALAHALWVHGAAQAAWRGPAAGGNAHLRLTIERDGANGNDLTARLRATDADGRPPGDGPPGNADLAPAETRHDGFRQLAAARDAGATAAGDWLRDRLAQAARAAAARQAEPAPRVRVWGYAADRPPDRFRLRRGDAPLGADAPTVTGVSATAERELAEILGAWIAAQHGADHDLEVRIERVRAAGELIGQPALALALGNGADRPHRAPARMSAEPPFRGFEADGDGVALADGAALAAHAMALLRAHGYR